jgi:hypothetical protein
MNPMEEGKKKLYSATKQKIYELVEKKTNLNLKNPVDKKH